MTDIFVTSDGDWNEPEIQISGSGISLLMFGQRLNEVSSSLSIDVPELNSEFYPVSIKSLVIDVVNAENNRLTVTADSTKLRFVGTKEAFSILGDSLINYFSEESSINDHFQLDYYEGNEILNETGCKLIFICDR